MSYVVTTPPAAEPVSLAEAKAQLEVDVTDDDTHVARLISAAIAHVERITWRALITQTLTLTIPRFPGSRAAILLPGGNVQSITSVAYIDLAGDSQPLTEYLSDLSALTPYFIPAYQQSWPQSRIQPAAVTVTYVAGFGDDPEDVPQDIRHAILLLVRDWFEFPDGDNPRRSQLDRSINALLKPYVANDHALASFLA